MYRQLFRVSLRWTSEDMTHEYDAFVAVRQNIPPQMMRNACVAALTSVIGPEEYQYKTHAEVVRVELVGSVFVEPEVKDDRRFDAERAERMVA